MEHRNTNNLPKAATTPIAARWHRLPVLLAVVVYANTLLNGFVYDDQMMITQNRIVQQGWAGIPKLLTTTHLQGFMQLPGDGYRPLSLVMFAAEYALVGMQPWLGHAVNVAMFALCVWLLQRVIVLLAGAEHAVMAIVAASLFAVLPVHTEVVANIKSRDELLSFALGMLVLTNAVRYVRGGKAAHLPVALAMYLLALLAKENVLTLIVLIPLVTHLYGHNRARAWVVTAGMVGVAAVYALITWQVLQYNHTAPGIEGTDISVNALMGAPDAATRLATALLGMGIYLELLVLPYPLLCNYSYASIPYVTFANVWVLLSVAMWVGIAATGLYRLLKQPGDMMGLGVVWLVITISMFSNIVVLLGAQVAERFLFLPSAGYCIAVAAGLHWLASRSGAIRWRPIITVLLPVAIVYSGVAIARNGDWVDDRTLFARDMEQSPNDCRLAFFVAGHAAPPPGTKDVRAYDEQIALLSKALAIHPHFIQAHTTLAEVYETLGQYDSAYIHGIAVLRQQPDNAAAAYITGRVLYAVKRYPEAVQWLQTAVQLMPGHKEALLNMARCYDDGGMTDSAIVFYERVLAIDARNVTAIRGLGLACLRMGRYEPAIVQLTQLAAMTGDADDGNNLGAALLSAGRLPEAVAQFRVLLAANPQNTAACQNMVIAWKQLGRADSAAWYTAKCGGGTR
jgi:Flp pilus assembly protein TadD